MAGICINSIRKNGAGCDHRIVTVTLDGEQIEVHTMEAELDAMPWGAEEKQLFLKLNLKRLRLLGIPIANLIGRCVGGDEATNVKQYLLCTTVTLTNMRNAGANTYTNVPLGLNGERTLVEFTGCTEFRLMAWANLVGTGPWQFRVVRDSDDAVLYESPSITAAGERELDTDLLPLPAGAAGLMYVRLQMKSAVAADDPVVRKSVLMVR